MIDEVMRLNPSASYFTFKTNPKVKTYKIGDFVLSNNRKIICSVAGYSHHAKYFSQPCKFNPNRWQNNSQDRSKSIFKPYFGGIRICPGRYFIFTKFEILVFFYCLLSKFNVEIDVDATYVIDKNPQVSPKNLKIRVKPKL